MMLRLWRNNSILPLKEKTTEGLITDGGRSSTNFDYSIFGKYVTQFLFKVYIICTLSIVFIFSISTYIIVSNIVNYGSADYSFNVIQSVKENSDTFLKILYSYAAKCSLSRIGDNSSDLYHITVDHANVFESYCGDENQHVSYQNLCNSSLFEGCGDQTTEYVETIVMDALTWVRAEMSKVHFEKPSQYIYFYSIVKTGSQITLELHHCLTHTSNTILDENQYSHYKLSSLSDIKELSLLSVTTYHHINDIKDASCHSILNNQTALEKYLQNVDLVMADLTAVLVSLKQEIDDHIKDTETFFVGNIIAILVMCLFTLTMLMAVVFTTRIMNKFIVTFTKEIQHKTFELDKEKQTAEELLYQMIPKTVVSHLKDRSGRVFAETFDSVSIFFSDVVGFTAMAAESSPMQVVEFLNSMYSMFDERIDVYDVYKVETIGDAYMVASGVPNRNGKKHAEEIATMAIDLVGSIKQLKHPHKDSEHIQIRVGIHSGHCVAGVVGIKMPRYCLFGDSVNTASRMESNSLPLKIHISKDTRDILESTQLYEITSRGEINVKGKGLMETFWLEGRKDMTTTDDAMVCLWRPKKKPKVEIKETVSETSKVTLNSDTANKETVNIKHSAVSVSQMEVQMSSKTKDSAESVSKMADQLPSNTKQSVESVSKMADQLLLSTKQSVESIGKMAEKVPSRTDESFESVSKMAEKVLSNTNKQSPESVSKMAEKIPSNISTQSCSFLYNQAKEPLVCSSSHFENKTSKQRSNLDDCSININSLVIKQNNDELENQANTQDRSSERDFSRHLVGSCNNGGTHLDDSLTIDQSTNPFVTNPYGNREWINVIVHRVTEDMNREESE